MNFEVIVVGCGPAGPACELALARVRVAVLEKVAEPTGFSKPWGFSRALWRCWSTGESLTALQPAIRRVLF